MTRLRRWIAARLGGDAEDGRIMVLAAGLFAILGVLVVGGIDLTAVQLAKMRVLNATDSAALEAADSLDESAVYRGGLGAGTPLTGQRVAEAASGSLARQQVPTNVSAWQVTGGDVSGNNTAVVRVQALVHPPLTGGLLSFLGADVSVSVESRARSTVQR